MNDYAEQRELVIKQMMSVGYPRDIAEHETDHAEDIVIDDDISPDYFW